MASSESWLIVNPKHNNRDLVVRVRNSQGELTTYRILRPGQSCAPDRAYVEIEEKVRPIRISLDKDGSYIQDASIPRGLKKAKMQS